jgi:hypothetical protein
MSLPFSVPNIINLIKRIIEIESVVNMFFEFYIIFLCHRKDL